MKKLIIFGVILFTPYLSFGQSLGKISNVNSLVTRLLAIGDIALYFLVSLAVLYIVWNVFNYLIKPAGGEDRSEALKGIGWGLLGLFIIVSLWGLVNILVNSFSTDPNVPRNRFPNANFFESEKPIDPSYYEYNSSINDPGVGNFDSRPGNTGTKENNWNEGLDSYSNENTQNYYH